MTGWSAEAVSLDDAAYRALLAETGAGGFASPSWATVLADGLGFAPEALILRRGGTARGAVTLFSRRVGPVHLVYGGLPYGATVGELPEGEVLSTLIGGWARRRRVARVRLFDDPRRRYPELGWRATHDVTHVIRLAGVEEEQLWSGFKRGVRRDVRKAERMGVEVRESTNAEGADAFHALYLESMRRNRAAARYGRELVRRVAEWCATDGSGAILLAWREERPIAGIVAVDANGSSHYLLGGSTTAGLRFLPNDLLIWSAIRRSLSLGHRAFDLLPSGPGDAALQRFKSKWGAEPVAVTTHDLVLRPATIALWETALRIVPRLKRGPRPAAGRLLASPETGAEDEGER